MTGHLATIGSTEENQFIVDSLLETNQDQPTVADEFYIGGAFNGASWNWVSGEPFDYTNWGPSEPSGDGVGLAIWGATTSQVGLWNDVPSNGVPGSIHQHWAIIEFGEDTPVHDSTLINLVQWPAVDGGNDHWYGVIAALQSWDGQSSFATTFTHNGVSGHLATVESASENQFMVDNVIALTHGQPSVADEYYIGGTLSGGQWHWVTGEIYGYTNWGQSEPSGDGPGMAIWGSSSGSVGLWNDVPVDGAPGSLHEHWAIIEFGIDSLPDDTISHLVKWPVSAGGNDHWYGLIQTILPWDTQRIFAESLSVEGVQGHLATIGSQAENQFILDNFLTNDLIQPDVPDEFYIGGQRLGGIWRWVTSEPFAYQNWNIGEPSGDGTGLAIWGATTGLQGLWNDVPAYGPIGSIHQHWAIVEFGLDSLPPDTTVQDTLINLVQWRATAGGNNHWYGIIPIITSWNAQRDIAASLTYDSLSGHLATITSVAENQFIVDSLVKENTNQPAIVDEFYIGGTVTGTSWEWVTGEQFSYTNWNSTEPSGDGTGLAIWGAGSPYLGLWNDLPANGGPSSIHQHWAIVEFGIDAPPGDSLIFPSITASFDQNVQPVQSSTTQPITGVTVPIKTPDFGSNFSISTTGLITQDWDYQIAQVKDDSGFIFVALFNTTGATIPSGVNTLFNIHFDASNPYCDRDLVAHWDTALMRDPSRQLLFSDTNSLPIHPVFSRDLGAVTIAPHEPGDADNSGVFDISDLVFAVDYMFGGGPAPVSVNALDVNGDCSGPDISDIVRMVANIFLNNPPPLECGCLASGKRTDYLNNSSMRMYAEFKNGKTVVYLHSDEPVLGVQLSMSTPAAANIKSLAPGNMALVYGYQGELLKAGLLDLHGDSRLAAGTNELIVIEGQAEIVSALVADNAGNPVVPVINKQADNLPTSYTLNQNYPNPFNPTTEIQFGLPQSGQVVLTIYNINGQSVATLANQVMDAGVHVVSWNGQDQTGSVVASGVYFYKLEVNGFRETKKMLLLK